MGQAPYCPRCGTALPLVAPGERRPPPPAAPPWPDAPAEPVPGAGMPTGHESGRCPACGTAAAAGYEACPRCGAPLHPPFGYPGDDRWRLPDVHGLAAGATSAATAHQAAPAIPRRPRSGGPSDRVMTAVFAVVAALVGAALVALLVGAEDGRRPTLESGASAPTTAAPPTTSPGDPGSGLGPATDEVTFTERWRVDLAGSYLDAPIETAGVVVVASRDGEVRGFDALLGTPLWTVVLDVDVTAPLTAAGDLVLVPAHVEEPAFGGRLYALDAVTGAERWRFDAPTAVQHPAAAADERAVLATGSVHALDLASGVQQWSNEIRRNLYEVSVAGDTAFVGGAGEVVAFDLATGSVRWRVPASGVMGRPIAAGDAVYVADAEGDVLALDGATGRQRWEVEQVGAGAVNLLAADSTLLWVGDSGGRLACLDALRGVVVWAVEGLRSIPSAELAGNTLLVGAGDALAFDAVTGRVTGEHRFVDGISISRGDHLAFDGTAAYFLVRGRGFSLVALDVTG